MTLRAVRRESGERVIGICYSGVIAMMAGIALGRGTCVASSMATDAGNGGVRSGEWECTQIVIER